MGVDTENFVEKIKSGKYNPTTDNQVSFTDFTLAEYLNQLLDEKNLSRKEVIKKSLLKQVPTSHIFEGVTKEHARERILALALAMELDTEETDKLLVYANKSQLYARRSNWEAIIFSGIIHHWGIDKTNEALYDAGETPLLGDI